MFLTAKDLSRRWKVTEMTLRRWRRADKLRAYLLGRSVRFAMEDVIRFEKEASS